MSRILFDAFDTGAAPVVPPSGPSGTLLAAVDPEAGVVHRVQYRTDVQKSRSGLERRTRLISAPRDTVECRITVDTEAVFRTLRSERVFRPTDVYLVPLRFEGAAVRGAVTSTTIELDVTYLDWVVPGQRVYVEAPAGGYQAVVQSSSASSGIATVTLDVAPSGGPFPDGATVVSPVRPFYLQPSSTVGRYANAAGSWQVTLRGHSPISPIGTGATSINTFDGLPVLDVRPLVTGLGAEDRPDGQVAVLDYEAKIQLEWARSEADVYRGHIYRIGSHADRQYFRRFLETVRGRQKAFLLPTWRPDFAVTSNSGTTVTLGDGGDYAARWFAGTAHRRIRLVTAAGATHDRVVTAASGNPSVLTLSTSLGVSAATVTMLEVARLANDQVEFRYDHAVMGTISMGFLVVQQ